MNINMPQVGALVSIRGAKGTLIYEVMTCDEKAGEIALRIQALKFTKTGPGPTKGEVEYKNGDIINITQMCPHCGEVI